MVTRVYQNNRLRTVVERFITKSGLIATYILEVFTNLARVLRIVERAIALELALASYGDAAAQGNAATSSRLES